MSYRVAVPVQHKTAKPAVILAERSPQTWISECELELGCWKC